MKFGEQRSILCDSFLHQSIKVKDTTAGSNVYCIEVDNILSSLSHITRRKKTTTHLPERLAQVIRVIRMKVLHNVLSSLADIISFIKNTCQNRSVIFLIALACKMEAPLFSWPSNILVQI